MARVFLTLALVCVMGSCGLLEPECTQVPGRDLVPGTYAFTELFGPDSLLAPYLPPAGARDVTLTISAERDEVVIRYELNGSEVEDRWDVVSSQR